jgi:hypothetical protein
MAGYVRWKDSLCQGCGVLADLGMDPRTTFSVTDEKCWGCKVREDTEDRIRKAAEKFPSTLNGLKVWISDAKPNRQLKVVADGE